MGWLDTSQKPTENKYVTHISLTPVDRQFPNVLKTPPENMLEAVQAAYRLTPDHRFLLALGEVHSFFTGEIPKTATATFTDKRWVINYQGQTVGTLTELPDFPDFLQLLSDWSMELNGQYPLSLTSSRGGEWEQTLSSQMDKTLVFHVVSALKEIDSLWGQGQRDPKLLVLAARGLALMTLQTSDRMEIMDPLPAKALAILSIARSLTRQDLRWEECLLAEAMDYSGHAIRLGNTLSASDPLRHYVNRNDPRLRTLAESKKASRMAQYLWLLRLAKLEDLQGWSLWLNTAFGNDPISLPLLKTGLDIKSFFTSRNFTREVQQIVLVELDREIHGASKKSPGLEVRNFLTNNAYYKVLNAFLGLDNPAIIELMEQMESRLETLEEKNKGPFLTASVHSSYYSSFFYTTMYIEGLYNLDSLSSPSGIKEFQAQLKGRAEVIIGRIKSLFKALKDNVFALRDTGRVSYASFGDFIDFSKSEPSRIDQFVLWYNHLVYSEFGTPEVQTLADDILKIKAFGAAPLHRTFKETKRYFKSSADTALFITLKRMAYRMDTRPHHRQLLGDMARKYLHDLNLSEKLYRSIVETSPNHYDAVVAKYAYFKNDKKMLIRLLNNPGVKIKIRSQILYYLMQHKDVKLEFIFKQYEKLIQDYPGNWDASYDYAYYLKENKKYSQARKVTRKWLDRNVPMPGLERIMSENLIAKAYYEEGRYEEGLQAVPESYKGSSLKLRGELLEKLGRLQDAEAVYRALQVRYSSSFTSGLPLVKLLWGQGRLKEAADLVLNSNYHISSNQWDFKFSPAFVDVFADKPKAEALNALSYFIQANISYNKVRRIPQLLIKKKHYERGFEIAKVIARENSEKMYNAIRYFEDYKKWKGEKAALAWVRKAIPENRRNVSSQYIFQEKQYELLWSLVTQPKKRVFPWQLRAAASLQYKGLKKKDRKELTQYFKKADNSYNLAGKYLLGIVTQKEFVRRCHSKSQRYATSPSVLGACAFYVGLKAETEGRLKEASDWYRVSMETNSYVAPEYHWAVLKLEIWGLQDRFLSVLDPN